MILEHNARRDHMDGIASLTRELPQLQGVELLPYTVDSWNKYLRKRGVRVIS